MDSTLVELVWIGLSSASVAHLVSLSVDERAANLRGDLFYFPDRGDCVNNFNLGTQLYVPTLQTDISDH